MYYVLKVYHMQETYTSQKWQTQIQVPLKTRLHPKPRIFAMLAYKSNGQKISTLGKG